jgi:uncharacterized protein YutD
LVGGKEYELVQEYKDAWKPDAFKERYSEVLDRYDYIVGDWGYNQLRLKGFFKDGSNKGPKEVAIASVQDYIQEYCNFGCAYFILERLPAKSGAPEGTSPEEPVVEAEAALIVASEDGEERPEGTHRIAGVAGGMAFSDRKPYSWREHQSTSRAARNAAAQAAAALAAEKGEGGGGRAEQGGGPRRDHRPGGGGDRRGDGRPGGGRPFDKPRYQPHQDRSGSSSEEGRGGQRPQQGGGGRKFPKGPRPGGGPGGPSAGGQGGGGHAGPKGGPGGPGGPGSRGGRPDGGAPREQQHAGRPEGAGGGRHAHQGGGRERDRAQQRHHHKPPAPQQ